MKDLIKKVETERVTLKNKYFILDTNIFCDNADCINNFLKDDENYVVITPLVVEELNKLKRGHNSRNIMARKALKNLAKYRRENNKKVVFSLTNVDGMMQIIQGIQTPEMGDAFFIHQALSFILQTAFGNENKYVVVTNDSGMYLRFTSAIDIATLPINSKNENGEDVVSHIPLPDDLKATITVEPYKTNMASADNIYSKCVSIPKYILNDITNADENIIEYLKDKGITLRAGEYFKFNDTEDLIGMKTEKGIKLINKNDVKPIHDLKPKNAEQIMLFHTLQNDKNEIISVIGRAGTGKSLLSLAYALDNVGEGKKYDRIIYVKEYLEVGRAYGFLPGDESEKLMKLKESVIDTFRFLYKDSQGGKYSDRFRNNDEGYGNDSGRSVFNYKERCGEIVFETPNWFRGRDIAKSIIIVDEAQNMNTHIIKTILTRAKDDTRIILAGDIKQVDDPYMTELNNGLATVSDKLQDEEFFKYIYLDTSERSKRIDIIDKKL